MKEEKIDLVELCEFYSSNKDFKDYVDKYMKTYRIIFLDVALSHRLVQEYYKYLRSSRND